MGWLFTKGSTRKELIAELTANSEYNGVVRRCLRHTAVGNVLWTVWEVSGHPEKGIYRYIGCDLLACQRGFGWGYKNMSESMGPFYYSCPLAYLDMVPVANQEWRDKVREYHASRNRVVDIGDVIVFEGVSVPEVRVVEKHGRTLVGEYDGKRYVIRPRFMARVVEHRKAA